jgi:hypothetical protein
VGESLYGSLMLCFQMIQQKIEFYVCKACLCADSKNSVVTHLVPGRARSILGTR